MNTFMKKMRTPSNSLIRRVCLNRPIKDGRVSNKTFVVRIRRKKNLSERNRFCFLSAKSATTTSERTFWKLTKTVHWTSEEIENDEKLGNVGGFEFFFVELCRRSTFLFVSRDQMRQMRRWQKQYGNRADPRLHVSRIDRANRTI